MGISQEGCLYTRSPPLYATYAAYVHSVHLTGRGGGVIQANRLVDASGKLVVLRGVSHSGSEYTCIHGGGGIFEGKIDQSFVDGLKTWRNLNAVRLPMNEDCWLGINGVKPQQGGAAYRSEFARVVKLLTSNHIAVLADLHW